MSCPKPTARPADDTLIDVRVIPRAGRSAITGQRDGALLVRLAAAPVDGAANAELIAVIAAALSLPKRCIEIVSGGRSRSKRVRVDGMRREEALAALAIPAGRATHDTDDTTMPARRSARRRS